MVSIIIPYYNRPEKLERSLSSIFSQTYQDFEILVVDDCSIIPFQIKHKNVKYLQNPTNSGPGVSRNLGLKHAKGEFITFLDSDDYWDKFFLETLIPVLISNPDACMAYCNGVKIDENCKVIGARRKKIIYPTTILPNILYNGRRWGTGGCVWRASCINHVQFLEYRSWEDYAFDVAVGVKHNIVVPVKRNLVFYDVSGDDKLSKNSEVTYVIEKHKSILAISKLLLQHDYRSNPLVNSSVTILIILNTIKLIRLDLAIRDYLSENLNSIREWRNLRFYFYMLFLVTLPKKIGIIYLKKLRHKVSSDNLFLLK
uniref:glycosyltransferase family 2 protein n=1 Tax=Gelidibacter sp. TaxID=2018083 RepID=UPI0040496052